MVNNIDYTHKYNWLHMLYISVGCLCGAKSDLLSTLVKDAIELGRWHRHGAIVYVSFPDERSTIEILAEPLNDMLLCVTTGLVVGYGGFVGKRLDRATTRLLAETCYY
jgi:hypothetical protein